MGRLICKLRSTPSMFCCSAMTRHMTMAYDATNFSNLDFTLLLAISRRTRKGVKDFPSRRHPPSIPGIYRPRQPPSAAIRSSTLLSAALRSGPSYIGGTEASRPMRDGPRRIEKQEDASRPSCVTKCVRYGSATLRRMESLHPLCRGTGACSDSEDEKATAEGRCLEKHCREPSQR